jgi:hypothetical protein
MKSTMVILLLALFSLSAFSTPQLNSFPSAQATIYLDFDGQVVSGTVWNSGIGTINAAPSGFNDVEITSMFNRVAEDYKPFNGIQIPTTVLVDQGQLKINMNFKEIKINSGLKAEDIK